MIFILFSTRPGSLAAFGKLLGSHGVGLEGGGVFSSQDGGQAHFLVEDGEKALQVLANAGFTVKNVCRPLIRKLPQQRPGEPGEIADAIARIGIRILVQYSEHSNRLILLTEDNDRAADVTRK